MNCPNLCRQFPFVVEFYGLWMRDTIPVSLTDTGFLSGCGGRTRTYALLRCPAVPSHNKVCYATLKEKFQGSGLKLSAEMAQYIVRTGQKEQFAEYQRSIDHQQGEERS